MTSATCYCSSFLLLLIVWTFWTSVQFFSLRLLESIMTTSQWYQAIDINNSRSSLICSYKFLIEWNLQFSQLILYQNKIWMWRATLHLPLRTDWETGERTKHEKEDLIKWVKKPSSNEKTVKHLLQKRKLKIISEFSWSVEEPKAHYANKHLWKGFSTHVVQKKITSFNLVLSNVLNDKALEPYFRELLTEQKKQICISQN